MQIRWRFKLHPSLHQQALLAEWLITLRKHYNYSLRERINCYQNNHAVVMGPYCNLENRAEATPLTCPLRKHGVDCASPFKLKRKTQAIVYRSVGEVQSARTTQLRRKSPWYGRVDPDVLQRNLARLDTAFVNFWRHGRGFPQFKTAAVFNSFEYKRGQVKLTVNPQTGDKHRYSLAYLPGMGQIKYFDSRSIPANAIQRNVVILRESDGWYMSVLPQLDEDLSATQPIETVHSLVGVDVGINKLASLSDGSFIENVRPATHKRMKRRMKIRQRRINRKVTGSKNRAKAGKAVARLHQKVRHKREAVQWNAAQKIVNTAEAVTHERLNIPAMSKRCQPKRSDTGRFLPNGQSAKRGLNRAILDAAWGDLFQKIGWLAMKVGKPVVQFYTPHSSQECSICGHTDPDNRDGEKFLCTQCGHIDHADTQAARTGLKRTMQDYNLQFKPKKLPGDSREVTPVRHQYASHGNRTEGRNPTSKVEPSKPEAGITERIA